MKRLGGTACLAFVLTGLWGGAAVASCAAPPPMGQAVDEAHAAFVGRVTATSSEGRWATVQVSEVWDGDVADVVEVRGGPEDPPGPMGAASSVDRTYREGETYLFLPYASKGDDVFLDNSCSSTTAFSERLERFRPGGAAPVDPEDPAPEPVADGGLSPWWGALAVAAAGAGAWAWRRYAAP